MRSSIVFILGVCLVAVIVFAVLLGSDRPPANAPNSVKVSVSSGEVQLSDTKNGQSQSIRAGDRAVAQADGSLVVHSASPDIPLVIETEAESQPAGEISLQASLLLSVKDTEGNIIKEATVTVEQKDKGSHTLLQEGGTAVLENLNPGNADIVLAHPLILSGTQTTVSLQGGPNELEMTVAMRALFPAQLVNKQAEPVTLADVSLHPSIESQKIAVSDLSDRTPDAGGYFTFDPVVSGAYILKVSASPYLPYEKTVLARNNIPVQRIVLSKTSQVTVLVQDKDSKPVGGAHVTLQSTTGSKSVFSSLQTNDLTGTTIFEDVPAGAYRVFASHSWYSDEGEGNQTFDVTKSTHDITLTLSNRNYSISGRVTEKDSGDPVEGAEVVAYADRIYTRRKDSGGRERSPDVSAFSGKDGTYTLKNLKGGTYIVGVSPSSRFIHIPILEENRFDAPSPTRILLDEEEDVNGVDFELLLPWIVTGRVLLSDGSPVEGANVVPSFKIQSVRGSSASLSSSSHGTMRSGADGSYRFAGKRYVFSENCTVNLTAYHEKYKWSPAVEVHPVSGREISNIDLVYDEGAGNYKPAVISGTVTSTDGELLDDAVVLFWGLNTSGYGPGRRSECKTLQGTYQISIVPESYAVRVTKEGYEHKDWEQPLTVSGGETYENVNFVLERGDESFEGRVSEDDGTPVPGLLVSLSTVFTFTQSTNPNAKLTDTFTSTLTDRNGRFRLFPAYARKTTFFRIFTEQTEVYKKAEYETPQWGEKNIHLTVERYDEGYGSIAGQVLDENQNPVSRFSLGLIPTKQDTADFSTLYQWRIISHPGGAFLIENIPVSNGPFILAAKAENSPTVYSKTIPLTKNQIIEGVHLILQQAFMVFGRVENSEGKPLEHIFIGLERDVSSIGVDERLYRQTLPQTTTNKEGFFRLTGLPLRGGELTVRYYHTNENQKSVPLPIGQAGEERDLGIILFE